MGYNRIFRCAEILLDERGCFTVAATRNKYSTEDIEHERQQLQTAFRLALSRALFRGDARRPIALKHNTLYVAMASSDTQTSDMILPISSTSRSSASFVTLRSNDVSFDIVGQGFFLPGFEILGFNKCPTADTISSNIEARQSIFDAELYLWVSITDILRLVGQDFVDLETYDPEARLRRLVTCAVDRPKGAVAPLYIQKYSYLDD